MTALFTAHPRGKRASAPAEPTAVDAVARSVGFVVLAGASLATLAAVVLLPAWVRLTEAECERELLAARMADEQAIIAANERLLEALPEDVVLTRRLVMSDLNALPYHQQVFARPGERTGPQPMVTIDPAPRPDPPEGWAMSAGRKLIRPSFRRGVFLLSVAGLTAAMIMFTPVKLRRSGG